MTQAQIANCILRRLEGRPKAEPTRKSIQVVRVVYHNPATIVFWNDGTKTVVKCQTGDKFDCELGFLLAVCKKVCGNTGVYNDLLRKHVPGYGGEKTQSEPSVEQMRDELTIFCHKSHCESCPMGMNGFECGRGKFFTDLEDEAGYMTDESIVKHYRAMEGAKSRAKEVPEDGQM